MLLKYWERHRLSRENWRRDLASMGVSDSPAMAVIEKVLNEKGEAVVSVYLFARLSGEPGSLMVCHDLGRGVISFGPNTQWGQWDEVYELLTIDGTGEKFDFDGKPVSEGDDGACSLGNI
jgi:hypothetical protein